MLDVRRSALIAIVFAALAGCQTGTLAPTATAPQSAIPGPSEIAASDLPGPAATMPPVWSRLTPQQLVTAPFSGVGNQFIFSVTAYGDGFVAVGEDLRFDGPVDGAIWTSPDGMGWTRLDVTRNDLANAEVDLVATNGTNLVALGGTRAGDASDEGRDRVLWLSEDGASWRRVSGAALPPFGSVFVNGLAGGPAGYVAWGIDGTTAAIFHSPDGATWTRSAADPSFDGAQVGDIRAYRGGFVAIGAHRAAPPPGGPIVVGGPDTSTAAAWWSPDGRSWRPAGIDAGSGLGSLQVGATGLFSLGSSGCGGCVGPSVVWRSTDGRQWTRIGPDTVPEPSYASDGARIIRYDFQGTGDVSSSTDGVEWQPIADLPRVGFYGFVVGSHGILIEDSIQRGAPTDEVDGGVLFVVAH